MPHRARLIRPTPAGVPSPADPVTTPSRWRIYRSIALFAVFSGGAALAGGLFGKKDETPPPDTPEVAVPEVEAAAPAAPEAPPLFPDGLPVALQQTPEGLANLSAQGCNACHWQAHDEWANTPHAAAWSDPEYQEAMARVGNTTACRSCHLPLANQHNRLAAGFVGGDFARPQMAENDIWDATLMAEGVTCAACHVREGTVISTRAAPDAPHPVAVSVELHSPEMCATCHQLTWPGADRPFYDTYGEWKASAYAQAGISCQECHLPAQTGTSAASRFAARPSHAFPADLGRGLSVLFDLESPEAQRGAPFPVRIRLQNTGAGHHIPTGSPFKTYRVSLHIEDAAGEALVAPAELELGRTVEAEPPWNTTADNRIPAGGEVAFEHAFEVSQKKAAQRATLVVRVEQVVTGADGAPSVSPPLLERRLPIQVL